MFGLKSAAKIKKKVQSTQAIASSHHRLTEAENTALAFLSTQSIARLSEWPFEN